MYLRLIRRGLPYTRHGRPQWPIEVLNRVLREIAEETLFSIPGGPTVKAVVKFMGEREMREVGN